MVLVDAPGHGFALGQRAEMEAWGKMMNNYLIQSIFL